MTKELAVKQEIVPQSYFVATNREEMAKAQSGLTSWVASKVEAVKKELRDVSKAVEHARAHKWAIGALMRQKNLWYGRKVYYEKMLEALQAGYVLVPEFPVDIFVIRTTRETPLKQENQTSYSWEGTSRPENHPPEKLEVGDGDYKNAIVPRFYHQTKWKDGDGKERETYHFYNDDTFSDLAFPLIAAKPEVMDATQHAMALKIFDSIGVCPPSKRRGDPLIIGIIEGPKVGYTQKKCHFLISWHIQTEDL